MTQAQISSWQWMDNKNFDTETEFKIVWKLLDFEIRSQISELTNFFNDLWLPEHFNSDHAISTAFTRPPACCAVWVQEEEKDSLVAH